MALEGAARARREAMRRLNNDDEEEFCTKEGKM
jgi:hypothetical protein